MEWDVNKLDAFSRGDLEVFREIMEATQVVVYNTALGIVKDPGDAEDIVQEVFIKLYENAERFRGDSKLTTWLYRVAVNTSLDHYRKKKGKKRQNFLSDMIAGRLQPEVTFDHPGVKLENKDHARELFKAMDKLPVNQQVVFVLFHLEGRSYNEIAEITGRSLTAVESLMARAKGNLQKTLRIYFEKHVSS
ncbi:MAG: RNA polymerase sigma factor [Chitinophagaceae bacterium]|nr:MAG: RNA polymerase sigma factor [Chitinophagaceae bacterium]